MLQRWLGADQTIDLKEWALCLGLRKAYLDTLPNRRWAGHVILLDETQCPVELLRLTLDDGKVRLRFLPPEVLKISGAQNRDLVTLAEQVAKASPADPPSLFTILLTRRAVSELVIAALAEPVRADLYRARLAASYGRDWAVHAITSLGRELVQSALRNELWGQLTGWTRSVEGQTLVFHRDNAPATRGGVRLQNRQLEMLASEDLISVPGATWVDERFVGDMIALLDRLLRKPPRNPLGAYSEINALFKYLRLPNNKSPSILRALPNMFKGRWFMKRSKASPPPPTPPPSPPAKMALALYFQINGPSENGETWTAQIERYRYLIDTLTRYKRVHVSIGWTETALLRLAADAPDLFAQYKQGVERGLFETTCALDTLPMPMLTTRKIIRAQILNWERIAAQSAGLWARGLVPRAGKLTPGWGEALRGQDYRFVAVPAPVIQCAYPQFDPALPLSVEGWSMLGFHQELSRILSMGVMDGSLDLYLQYLAAAYAGRTLAARIDIDALYDLTWLNPLLAAVRDQGHSLVFLSELGSAHAQGTTNLSADSAYLQGWTSNDQSRAVNAAFTQAWTRGQSLAALSDQVTVEEDEQSLQQDARQLVLSIPHHHPQFTPAVDLARAASGHNTALAVAARTLDSQNALIRRWMLKQRSTLTLPEHALGTVRIFEPHDLDHRGCMLEVQLAVREGLDPAGVSFFDQGMAVPSQYLGMVEDKARYVLSLDINAGEFKDLVALSGVIVPSPEGLDVTQERLCNPFLAVLLDAKGQITSIRYQGQERLCGTSNQLSGYVLNSGERLRTDLVDAEIEVTFAGPVRGTVTVHQDLGSVQVTRRLHIGLYTPLLECETELRFLEPVKLASRLVVGEFDLIGTQVGWSLPLQAGSEIVDTASMPGIIFAPHDVVDVRQGGVGLRYMAHWASTRAYYFEARPLADGVRLGLISSMPAPQTVPSCLGDQPGLGFPGATLDGTMVLKYALQPLSHELGVHAAFYNRPLLWSFFPR